MGKGLIGVLAICLAIVISVSIAARAVLNRNERARAVTVTGSTRVDFTSDLIVWNGSFSRKAPDLQSAFPKLEADRAIVQEYLVSKGVKPESIVFSSININKETEQVVEVGRMIHNRFTGFNLTQRVHVESSEVDKIEKVSREVTELINKGVEFMSEDPRYYYTKLAELKIQMINAATEDGKQRAERIATSAGAHLGRLKSASLGVFQITAPYSNEEMSWEGVFNTASKSKTALVTVRLQFGVS